MDQLSDILRQNQPQQPPEIGIIKEFVRQHFQADCLVTVRPHQIVITVKGAALAGALRPYLHELQKLCDTQNRLIIHIGS